MHLPYPKASSTDLDELLALMMLTWQLRITMAAIDPSAPPQLDGHPEGAAPRATLKLIRASMSDDSDSSEDEDDLEALKARIVSASDLDSDESDPGPSDPSKAMKARMEANLKALEDSIHDADMETEDGAGAANGVKSDKGKAKAVDDESGESSDEDDDVEEFVVCTLDPAGVCACCLSIGSSPNSARPASSRSTSPFPSTKKYSSP